MTPTPDDRRWRELADLFAATAPPPPADEAWDAVHAEIVSELSPPSGGRKPPECDAIREAKTQRAYTPRSGVLIVSLVAIAAAVLVWVGRPQPVAVPSPVVVPETAAVLDVATDDDVVIHRVVGGADDWLVVGVHPLAGPLALATVDEVEVVAADPGDPNWPGGGPDIRTVPGDAPMIFATSPR